jgi:hypothetical protein
MPAAAMSLCVDAGHVSSTFVTLLTVRQPGVSTYARGVGDVDWTLTAERTRLPHVHGFVNRG